MSRPRPPAVDADLRTPPPGRTSWEAFLAWLDEDVRAEWVDGEIEVMEPVSLEHQSLNLFLAELLNGYVRARSLGVVLLPFPMLLPNRRRGRSPDLLFVAAEHRGRLRRTSLDGPADVAVEIVSPESVERDHRTKVAEYAAGGVREYWLIDPEERRAVFYRLQPQGRYEPGPVDGDGVYRSAVIPGFWLRVDWLWQQPPPPAATLLRLYEG